MGVVGLVRLPSTHEHRHGYGLISDVVFSVLFLHVLASDGVFFLVGHG
jgi:hypothetical protein